MIAYILALMSFLQPQDTPGVKWDYWPVAVAISRVAQEAPLWARGDRGVVRTATLLVSLAWFESRFNPEAVGDSGSSVGLYQINPYTADVSADALTDPLAATEAAVRLVAQSFTICFGRPEEERLAWYAHGGRGCGTAGARESKHRMWKAEWLERKMPMPESVDNRP